MLDRLEASGFLVREPSRDDRRKILIRRTRKDKALQRTYARLSQEMTDLFYQGFSASEIDRCEESLRRILDNLVTDDENAC